MADKSVSESEHRTPKVILELVTNQPLDAKMKDALLSDSPVPKIFPSQLGLQSDR